MQPEPDKTVLSACSLAKELIERGNYEEAQKTLASWWRGIDLRPQLGGLTSGESAEVLLQTGILTARIGRARQSSEAQQKAKELIEESLALFVALGERRKAGEARTELGQCYINEGAYKAARIVLKNALEVLSEESDDIRINALIKIAIIETKCNCWDKAAALLNEAAPLVEATYELNLKAKYHLQNGAVLCQLGKFKRNNEYLERAAAEYLNSSRYSSAAGNERLLAYAENNLGVLLIEFSKYDEALKHLENAAEVFAKSQKVGFLAEVNESRARVLLHQGNPLEALELIGNVIETVKHGGQNAFLAEALMTQGIILAKLGEKERAVAAHLQAIKIASQANAQTLAVLPHFKVKIMLWLEKLKNLRKSSGSKRVLN